MARIRTIKPEFWPNANGLWASGPCHVYVLQEGRSNRSKIGIAGHPIQRLTMLNGGNPRRLHLRAVFAGDRADCIVAEAAVLSEFQQWRLHGEWMQVPHDEIISFIEYHFAEDSDG